MKFAYPISKKSARWAYRMLAHRKGIYCAVVAMHNAGWTHASIRYTFKQC